MSLLDGLISWWDLDEQSGTRLDAHGLHDLSASGTVGYTSGGHGTAAVLTTSNQLVAADTAALRAGGANGWTFMMWMYRATDGGSSAEWYASKWGSGGNEWVLRSDTEFISYLSGSGDVRFTASPSLMGTGWNFVAVGRDPATSEAFLYINGTRTTASGATSGNSGTSALTINGNSSGNFKTTFYAASAAFWQRALTVDELDALYALGNSLSYADLFGGTPEPVTHEASAAEALSLTDGLSALASLYGARTEQAALSDAIAAQAVLNAQSADALSITDATAVHAALQAQIAESLILEDAESASAVLQADRSDVIALLATQTGGNVLIESITEALTLSESLHGDISLEVAIAESLALSDAASAQSTLQATASEEISLVASHIASALLHAGVTEIVSVTSSVSASVVSTAVSLPDGRTLTVRAENRILTVAAENRIKIAR